MEETEFENAIGSYVGDFKIGRFYEHTGYNGEKHMIVQILSTPDEKSKAEVKLICQWNDTENEFMFLPDVRSFPLDVFHLNKIDDSVKSNIFWAVFNKKIARYDR